MPSRTYYRIWCKKCNDFELHRSKMQEDKDSILICNVCDTEYSEILLKDIPTGKILEQRKRYIEEKSRLNKEAMSHFLGGGYNNGLFDLFQDKWESPTIKESDAGQKSIDEKDLKEREAAREIRRVQREKDKELIAKYNNLGRNERCICGKVGNDNKPLKYKKCCLSEIRKLEYKIR